MAEIGGCHVCLSVVVANRTTVDRFARAIEAVDEAAEDYPFLALAKVAKDLRQVFEELEYVAD